MIAVVYVFLRNQNRPNTIVFLGGTVTVVAVGLLAVLCLAAMELSGHDRLDPRKILRQISGASGTSV